jgi:tetratricopeptide (TPR) repeat protein
MLFSPPNMTAQEIQEAFSRAQRAQTIGNFGYAESLCAAILRATPDAHPTRILLRRCQMARYRQKHGSYKPTSRISTYFSQRPSSDPLRDVEVAEASLKENPCDVAANQLLLHAVQKLGWTEIAQLCRDIIAEGTPSVENLLNKANGLRELRDFPKAIALLEKIQKQFPENLDVDKALRDAQAEAAAAGGWEKSQTFVEMIRPGTQPPADEVEALGEQIRKEPRNPGLLDRLISLLEKRGDSKSVLEWINYRRGLEDTPILRRKAFEIERRLGTLTLEKEVAELESFVREQPTDLDLRLELGSALLRYGEVQKAIAQLQRARKHAKISTRVDALVTVAQACDSVGLNELGQKSRNQALELAGEDESLKKEILYQMALSLEGQDKLDEARTRWLELFELDSEFKDTANRVLGS